MQWYVSLACGNVMKAGTLLIGEYWPVRAELLWLVTLRASAYTEVLRQALRAAWQSVAMNAKHQVQACHVWLTSRVRQ